MGEWRRVDMAEKGIVLLAVLVWGSAPTSAQFTSHGVALKSRIPLSSFPTGGARANDCWGYVSPSGREYAIIGLQTGTGFVEVTNPANATVVGYIAAPGVDEPWRDMQNLGRYAYVVSDRTGFGLQIIDMINIDQGTVTLLTTHTLNNLFFTAHDLAINPQTKYLYLCLSNISPGITAVNLNNPTSPVLSSSWPPPGINTRVHDVLVVSYTSGPFVGREIAFCFSENQGLKIVDVTVKTQMYLRSSVTYPGVRYCHQGWLSADRKYMFIDDELDETGQRTTTTYVMDVSDLDHPFYVTSFTNGLPAIDHNLMVRGNFVYEANYTSGLRVYDVTDVNCAREIAYLDTYPPDNARNFNGAWGVYTGLPSGTILVSDRDYGLFVARMDCNENGFDDQQDITLGRSLDLNDNDIPDECDGYIDCNSNDLSDRCEPDCDGDAIPDDCEADCQGNGLADVCEIIAGAVSDCNANGVPDGCDLAQFSSQDCNNNSLPDECDILHTLVAESPVLVPFGAIPPFPQSYTIPQAPPAEQDVTLFFTAYGDFDLVQKYVTVDIDGVIVGNVFDFPGFNCFTQPLRYDTLTVPRDVFNAAGASDVVIGMTASPHVNTNTACGDTYLQVRVEYLTIDPAKDCNGSGRPDECERGDPNGDGVKTADDFVGIFPCVTGPCPEATCSPSLYASPCCRLVDYDFDGDLDLADLAEWERRITLP